jgi:hypothetical protein
VQSGPLSRADLARRLDLSRASLTRLTKPLIEAGLLVEGLYEQQSATGRPAQLLNVVDDAHHFIGVNVTSRDASGVVVDLRANTLLSEVRDLDGRDPDHVLAVILALIDRLAIAVPRLLGIGISLGGVVIDRRTVTRAGFLGWQDEVRLGDADAARRLAPGLDVARQDSDQGGDERNRARCTTRRDGDR